MKKLFLVCASLLLSGCATSKTDTIANVTPTPIAIETIFQADGLADYKCNELPIEIPCGEGTLKCTTVDIYQKKSEYGYYLLGIVTFDLSNLSDADIYWLDNDRHFESCVTIKDKNDPTEKIKLGRLHIHDDNDTRYYMLWEYKEFRYPFENLDCSMIVKIGNGKLWDTYNYDFQAEKTKSVYEIDKDLYTIMNNAFKIKLEYIEGIIG